MSDDQPQPDSGQPTDEELVDLQLSDAEGGVASSLLDAPDDDSAP